MSTDDMTMRDRVGWIAFGLLLWLVAVGSVFVVSAFLE